MDVVVFAAVAVGTLWWKRRSDSPLVRSPSSVCFVTPENEEIQQDQAPHESDWWHRSTCIMILCSDKAGDAARTRRSKNTLVLFQRTLDYGNDGEEDACLTGGIVEYGETYRDCAIRVLREKWGITIGPSSNNTLTRLFTYPYQRNGFARWTEFYECIYREPVAKLKLQSEAVDQMLLGQLRDRIECVPRDFTPETLNALQLYFQRLDDLRVNRKLLSGYSSGNLDSYGLRPKLKVVFFDCDDCLYFDGWKTANQLTKKIDEWCVNHGLQKGEAYDLYKKYGTALRGLLAEGYVEKTEDAINRFLADVHDIPVHELLQPDLALREMLLRMDPSLPKYIFTASVRDHAQRCLEALGISDLFLDIIDCKKCDLETKHSLHSFQTAMRIAGVKNPEECLFFDDNLKNISAARKIGWRSILVGKIGRDCGTPISSEDAELQVHRIHDIAEALPELFVPLDSEQNGRIRN